MRQADGRGVRPLGLLQEAVAVAAGQKLDRCVGGIDRLQRQPQREGGELVACDEAGILMPGGAGFASAFAVESDGQKLHGSLVQATGALEPRDQVGLLQQIGELGQVVLQKPEGFYLDLPAIGSLQDGSCESTQSGAAAVVQQFGQPGKPIPLQAGVSEAHGSADTASSTRCHRYQGSV